jgi:hypothetical protein
MSIFICVLTTDVISSLSFFSALRMYMRTGGIHHRTDCTIMRATVANCFFNLTMQLIYSTHI